MNTGIIVFIAKVIDWFSLLYILTINTIYLIQLLTASAALKKYVRTLRYSDYDRYQGSRNMVPISLLVPAYNEELTIVDNVRNLLSLTYPEYEVIVVNDGSKDRTLAELMTAFRLIPIHQPYRESIRTKKVRTVYRSALYPNLIVMDKENGGKADALNAGINASSYPIFVSIDADSILEKKSLLKIIYVFMNHPECVAVGGIVRIGTGCKIVNSQIESIGLSGKPLVMLQTNEYLRAFLTGRISFGHMGMLLIISGAFGAFNKQAVIAAGGYTTDCIGEDMELVVKLHKYMIENRRKYSIRFLPDPICWTQPPEKLGDLHKQRKRWQIGLIDTLKLHRDMVFNVKYGKIGMLCLPYYWIFEFLGPLIETLGYFVVPVSWIFGFINVKFMLTFFLVAILYGSILSVGALFMEESTFQKYPQVSQILYLFLYAFLENLGYRQLNTLYRVEGMFTYRRQRSQWGSIERHAFDD